MRGKRAKAIRRLIYGEEGSSRARHYEWEEIKAKRRSIRISDPMRRVYQALKREWHTSSAR